MPISKRLAAEFLGTFWLVLRRLRQRRARRRLPTLGIEYVGVALAFGLTLLTMAFAIGHISGCNLNCRLAQPHAATQSACERRNTGTLRIN